MAEGLFVKLLDGEDGWEVGSAGVGTMGGQPPSGHTLSILEGEGIDLSGNRSQPLTLDLIRRSSHIFTMTLGHMQAVEMLFPEAVEKTFLVTEFCANEGLRGRDVPDPIGMGRATYEETRDLLHEALPSVLEFVRQTSKQPETNNNEDPAMSNVTLEKPLIEPAAVNDPGPDIALPASVIVGADHGGYELKKTVTEYLKRKGLSVEDIGPDNADPVDYPEYAQRVAHGVADGNFDTGILFCTSGVGMSITANKVQGIRAALISDARGAALAREHNNANVLCLAGASVDEAGARDIVDAWLETAFSGEERHARRVGKINAGDCALGVTDPEVAKAVAAERSRQQNNIELIASENFTSRAVMEAQGSVLTNKYAEGYPGRRWYGGCENVDVVEKLAIERAKELFAAEHANVQPHSGSQANAAVYFSMLEHGDTILTMDLSHGGHLTHGHPANFSGKFYNVVHYGVAEGSEVIDYDQLAEMAKDCQPAMITAGASAYSRVIDFKRMAEIAKSVDALLFVDMAHIAGLVATGVHPSPVPHADFVTTTTHKSLRGPRGGLILCREEYAKKIDSMVFPGVQGGPLMHVIAAKAVCLKEALEPGFKEYQMQVVGNASTLAEKLAGHGWRIISGGTENHLFMVDLRPNGINGKIAQEALDHAGITVNKNSIPFDTESPFKGGGIRVGTPAVTTRGMKESEMETIADFMNEALNHREDEAKLAEIRDKVVALNARFPLP